MFLVSGLLGSSTGSHKIIKYLYFGQWRRSQVGPFMGTYRPHHLSLLPWMLSRNGGYYSVEIILRRGIPLLQGSIPTYWSGRWSPPVWYDYVVRFVHKGGCAAFTGERGVTCRYQVPPWYLTNGYVILFQININIFCNLFGASYIFVRRNERLYRSCIQ